MYAIRHARTEDADFLARVMLSASRAHLNRGVWDLIIGADDEGCLDYLRRIAVAEPRSLFHHENFLIAEVDGWPGAALCRYTIDADVWKNAEEAMAKVEHEIGWREADWIASKQRTAPLWACFLPDVGADWGIENVATRPDCRRCGLAKRLVEHALREGSGRGCRLAQITMSIGNEAALAVYLKCGFRVSDEKRSSEMPALLGSPGFLRLLREL